MSEALTPKEIARAASQGVAIALNARKPKPHANTEELFIPPHLICGIPPAIFEVALKADSAGLYSAGEPTATKE
jgi:hypothetical protein